MRLAGAALFLTISSCGGRVEVDHAEPTQPTVSACVEACKAQFPDGKMNFDIVSSQCACNGCGDACNHQVCEQHDLPTDACLPCVVANIEGDACMEHAGLFTHCFEPHDVCYPFITCLEGCN